MSASVAAVSHAVRAAGPVAGWLRPSTALRPISSAGAVPSATAAASATVAVPNATAAGASTRRIPKQSISRPWTTVETEKAIVPAATATPPSPNDPVA